jgi:hypothetical protein
MKVASDMTLNMIADIRYCCSLQSVISKLDERNIRLMELDSDN